MQAKHVALCIHLLFTALLVATLKLRTFLFLGCHTDTLLLCGSLDIRRVFFILYFFSSDSYAEGRFFVVNITLSSSNLHILPLFILGRGCSQLQYVKCHGHWSDLFISMHPMHIAVLFKKKNYLKIQCLKRENVKRTVSTAIMFCLYVNIELSFISSINGSISYH